MIKLKEYSNKNDFVINYVDDKLAKIEKKLDDKDNTFFTLFPEAKRDKKLNKDFFIDLLSGKIFDVIQKYPSVKMYYKIAFISSLSIKEICKRKSFDEALEIRKKYIEEFLSNNGYNTHNINDIIKDYAKDFILNQDIKVYIYQNEDNFIKFQKYIAKKVLNNKRLKKNRVRYGALYKIFDYRNMLTSQGKADIIKNLDVLVCPYCNRSYISNFRDNWGDDVERTSADLDHFFCKSNFVLFSLSLYNFIPSCKICNSLFKGDKNLDILYPYEDSYEDKAKFTLVDSGDIVEAKDIYGWTRGKKIDISYSTNLKNDKKEKILREIQLFRILEIYQVHNDFAEKILYSKNILGGSIKENILECINRNLEEHDQLKITEFNKFFYGIDLNNIKKDIHKEPLSKLIYDITKYSDHYIL